MRIFIKLFLIAVVLFAVFILLTVYAPKPVIEKDGGASVRCQLLFQGQPWDMPVAKSDETLLSKVIKQRLRALGFSHSEIKVGPVIEVKIPKVQESDLGLIKAALERAGHLSFHLVVDRSAGLTEDEVDQELARLIKKKEAGDDLTKEKYTLALSEAKSQELGGARRGEADRTYELLENPGFAGEILKKSYPYTDSMGRDSIGLEFTFEGAQKMRALTSENLKRKLAIVLDGEVVQSALIQEPISDSAVINALEEGTNIRALVAALNGGVFPYEMGLRQLDASLLPKVKSSGRGRFITAVVSLTLLLIVGILLFPHKKTAEESTAKD